MGLFPDVLATVELKEEIVDEREREASWLLRVGRNSAEEVGKEACGVVELSKREVEAKESGGIGASAGEVGSVAIEALFEREREVGALG